MSERRGDRQGVCPLTVHCSGYVMGELSAIEHMAFEEHLLEGCSRCASELERLRRAAAHLDLAAGDEAPPSSLRDRVLRAASSVRAGGVEFADRSEGQLQEMLSIAVVAADGTPWQPTDVAGVDVRVLAQDVENRTISTLMRLAPGATYPSHLHRGREECFVLEGDLRFGDQVMGEGDHMVAVAGSVHTELTSREGCTALVISCLDDERLG